MTSEEVRPAPGCIVDLSSSDSDGVGEVPPHPKQARLDEVATDEVGLQALEDAKFAKGSSKVMLCRRAWWFRRCEARQLAPVPLTLYKLNLVAALLLKGRYRAGDLYLAEIKRMHIEAGFAWLDVLTLTFRDCVRALRRGRGPPRQADPLPLDEIVALPSDWPPVGCLGRWNCRQQ